MAMNPLAVRSLAQRGAELKLSLYPHACTYEGTDFIATKMPTRDARELRAGGITVDSDTVIRLLKSALPMVPVSETLVLVDGKQYRIAEVKDVSDPIGEWVLALHNLA
jgi:hypothetical protein